MSDITKIAAAKAALAEYDAVWCPECSLERHDADTPHGGEGYPVDFMARHLRAVLDAYDDVVAERDEARAIVNACVSACAITTVVFAGDVPTYIRSCFDSVTAERDALAARLAEAALARNHIPLEKP